MGAEKVGKGAGPGRAGAAGGGAGKRILPEERLRFAARYMPGEFRGDWDPLWGHPLDRRAGDELLEEISTER